MVAAMLLSSLCRLRLYQCRAYPFGRSAAPVFKRQQAAVSRGLSVSPVASQAASSAGRDSHEAPGRQGGQGGGVHTQWRSLWSSLLGQLYAAGHFAADPHVPPSQLEANKGAVKRAVLSFARQRGDLRHSLPEEDLRALVSCGFPQEDRKSVNAYKRLEASILRGQDLPAADGGPADFQDVARMLYALSLVDPVTAELESPGLAAAAVCLMPSIISAAQEPASVSSQDAGSSRGVPRPVYQAQRKQREPWQREQQHGRATGPAGQSETAGGRRGVGVGGSQHNSSSSSRDWREADRQATGAQQQSARWRNARSWGRSERGS